MPKQTKEQIFDAQIAPLLEQIQEICKKNDIGAINAFQLANDSVNGAMISLSGFKSSDAISQLEVAARVLSGKVSVMDVPAKQAIDLGLTNGIMELVKQHADTCMDCSMKISNAASSGKTLTIEDFQHEGAVTLDVLSGVSETEATVAVETVAVPEPQIAVSVAPAEAKKPAKKKIVVSAMFTELMNQGGFKN
jgi:hypothetical protein